MSQLTSLFFVLTGSALHNNVYIYTAVCSQTQTEEERGTSDQSSSSRGGSDGDIGARAELSGIDSRPGNEQRFLDAVTADGRGRRRQRPTQQLPGKRRLRQGGEQLRQRAETHTPQTCHRSHCGLQSHRLLDFSGTRNEDSGDGGVKRRPVKAGRCSTA